MHVLFRPAVADLGVEMVQAAVFDRSEDISRHIDVRRQGFMHFPKGHKTVRHQVFGSLPIADIAVCQGDKTGLDSKNNFPNSVEEMLPVLTSAI